MESRRILNFCKENELLEAGDKVLLGLSGGADSVCLLFALLEIQEEFALTLTAVHVHHGIRGSEADRDEEFCRKLCLSQGVDFIAEHIDVPALALSSGDTLEEAGRKARYNIFERIAEADGFTKIAVAHHKNDQAETVLFQMARGSRLTGLTGIKPKNGRIIRPLLCLDRQEIEGFLEQKGLNFVIDSTNLENDASRNVLRNEVLPRLTDIQPGTVDHICETAEYLKRVDEYLERESDRLYQQAVTQEAGRITISIPMLRRAELLLAEKVLYRSLCELSGRKKDITHRHVERALELMDMQTGAKIDFKYGVQGQKAFENLIFTTKNKFDIDSPNCNNTSITSGLLRLTGETTAAFIERAGGFGESGFRKLLDLRVLQQSYPELGVSDIVCRCATGSDFIVVYKDGRRKKVFDLLMEARVPAEDRSRYVVAAYGQEAFLVKGLRGCEDYRVTDDTEEILIIEFQ